METGIRFHGIREAQLFMSGLVKAKVYNLRDSNVEKLGSNEDRALKKSSAQHEPAWRGMEDNVGLRVWRIEKLEVKDWPKEKYGRFYSGDSYIVLYSEKLEGSKKPDRSHHVHFWIGQNSTEDEYGTAAYKTVELDTYLDDAAIQHRECQEDESVEFKDYFGGNIIIDDGGIDSGFKHVDVGAPLNLKDALVHFKKVKIDSKGTEEYREVKMPLTKANLKFSGHVIVSSGKCIMQIKPERQAAIDSFSPFIDYWNKLKNSKPKAEFKIYESLEELKNDKDMNKLYQNAPDDEAIQLVRLSLDKGKSDDPFTKVPRKEDASPHTPLQDMSEDVFIMETLQGLLVFIGSRASSQEKQRAIKYVDKYGGRNCSCSIRRECQGSITGSWKKFFLALNNFHVKMPDEGLECIAKEQKGCMGEELAGAQKMFGPSHVTDVIN
ncbi:gelsolin-like protein 2 isoform X2 [Montipora foliosa]